MLLNKLLFASIFSFLLLNSQSESKQLAYSLRERNFSITTTVPHTPPPNLTTTISPEDCLPPNLYDYPSDIFTQSQRRYGAIIFHFIFALYLLQAIMRVCNDYFMNSLEIIGQVNSDLI